MKLLFCLNTNLDKAKSFAESIGKQADLDNVQMVNSSISPDGSLVFCGVIVDLDTEVDGQLIAITRSDEGVEREWTAYGESSEYQIGRRIIVDLAPEPQASSGVLIAGAIHGSHPPTASRP
jgi:hypothetical protein